MAFGRKYSRIKRKLFAGDIREREIMEWIPDTFLLNYSYTLLEEARIHQLVELSTLREVYIDLRQVPKMALKLRLSEVYIHFVKYLKLRFSAIRLGSAVRSGMTINICYYRGLKPENPGRFPNPCNA